MRQSTTSFVSSVLTDALYSGELHATTLFATEEHAPEVLADGWRTVIARLETGRVNDDALRLIAYLARADRIFPAAHFCLGLAHYLRGEPTLARRHFEAQLAHPSGEQAELSRAYLDELQGAQP